MYERKEKELIKRLLGIDEDDPSKRIDTFFRKYGSNFAQFLSMFESVGVEKDIIFLFANKEILKKLTKDVKTYDILHFLTALSNTMDGFLTTDKKFIKWLSKNKDLFKNEGIQSFKFFVIDTEKLEIEIKSFMDL